jgi:hypothetical protein
VGAFTIDDEGRETEVFPLERPTAGVLEGWLEKISRSQAAVGNVRDSTCRPEA